MTIKLNIDNPDMEEKLAEFVKDQKELTVDLLRNFLNSFYKKETLKFDKKDPKKHMRTIEYIDDDDEDLSDVRPYSYVEDSAQYIHKLRRQRNR